MNNLRYDPADPTDAHAPDLRERHNLDPEQLRIVHAYDPRYPDTRTESEKVVAELVRLVDAVQALRLEFDLHREDSNAAREVLERVADSVTVIMLERDMRIMEQAQQTIRFTSASPSYSVPVEQPINVTIGPISTVAGPIVVTDANGQQWRQANG